MLMVGELVKHFHVARSMSQCILGASAEMAGDENTKKVLVIPVKSAAEAESGERRVPPSPASHGSGVTSMPTSFVPGDIMTRNEVALLLRCSLPHVVTLIERDGLPAFRLGKLWRFRRSEVLAWCERKTNAKSER